jgi:hypothetical protein
LRFVSANSKSEDISDNEIALDIECGIKGEKDNNGRVHSCFAFLVKQHGDPVIIKNLRSLVKLVDTVDTYGLGARKLLGKSLPDETLLALTSTGLHAILRGFQALNRDDSWVCQQMFVILDGLAKNWQSRTLAEREADAQEIIGEVAITRNTQHRATNGVLMDRGAKFIVYVDGHNVGVSRRDGIRIPTSIVLEAVPKEERSEWFVHSAGFLTARGTRTAPATSSSKVDPRAIADLLNKSLNKQQPTNPITKLWGWITGGIRGRN